MSHGDANVRGFRMIPPVFHDAHGVLWLRVCAGSVHNDGVQQSQLVRRLVYKQEPDYTPGRFPHNKAGV